MGTVVNRPDIVCNAEGKPFGEVEYGDPRQLGSKFHHAILTRAPERTPAVCYGSQVTV